MRILSLLSIWILMVASGCKNKKNDRSAEAPVESNSAKEQVEKPVTLYYERTACFGTCPIFKFTVYNDNTCLYQGENFVDRIGNFTGKADRDEVIKVIDIAERIGYRELVDEYDNPMIMDIPAVITKVNTDGKTKTIYDRYRGPGSLESLYEAFEELINSIEWQKAEQ